jgi:hypothetical protein
MREKPKQRVLKLAKETVRRLVNPELERIRGGNDGPLSQTMGDGECDCPTGDL